MKRYRPVLSSGGIPIMEEHQSGGYLDVDQSALLLKGIKKRVAKECNHLIDCNATREACYVYAGAVLDVRNVFSREINTVLKGLYRDSHENK